MDEKLYNTAMNAQRGKRGFLRKHLDVGDCVFNASETADEKPVAADFWIDYWKQMTGNEIPNICPFCGLPLNADEAEGCHIVFPKSVEHLLGVMQKGVIRPKYIIPGHHNCNCQFGKLFDVKCSVDAYIAVSKKDK